MWVRQEKPMVFCTGNSNEKVTVKAGKSAEHRVTELLEGIKNITLSWFILLTQSSHWKIQGLGAEELDQWIRVCLPHAYIKSQVWPLSAVKSRLWGVETWGSLGFAGCQPSSRLSEGTEWWSRIPYVLLGPSQGYKMCRQTFTYNTRTQTHTYLNKDTIS